jgi:hypothetical protein
MGEAEAAKTRARPGPLLPDDGAEPPLRRIHWSRRPRIVGVRLKCSSRLTHDNITARFDLKVGRRFRSFRINSLEMVDQNSASWNRIAGWLKAIEGVRRAA